MNCYYAHNEQKKNKKELQVIIFKPKKKKKADNCSKTERNLPKINKSFEMIGSEFNSDIQSKKRIIFSNKNELKKDLNDLSTRKSKTLKNLDLIKKDLENNVQKVDVNKQKISNKYMINDNINSNNNIEKINVNNPINMKLIKELTIDSYTDYTLDNTFVVFISVDKIFYLIYTNNKRSIISFNLSDNKKINEIKNAHKRDITNFRYFLDKMKKRDLIISISLSDNNLKLWDISNYDCLLNIENVNKTGRLFSSCLFSNNNNNYILTSSAYGNNLESIKVFDFSGNKIKEINDKFGGLENIGNTLTNAKSVSESLEIVIWLTVLLANQAIMRKNLIEGSKEDEFAYQYRLCWEAAPNWLETFEKAISFLSLHS